MLSLMNNSLDFKTILSTELASRTKRNSSYSIRAFAKDLGINDSTLSQLISGKRKATKKRIQIVGKKLGLSNSKIIKLIEGENIQIDKDETKLSLQKFNLMSEWYFDAIIEIVKIKPNATAKEISKDLKITQAQAKTALKQLLDLEVIESDEDGFVCNQPKSLTAFYDSSFTNEALKEYQNQILKLSQRALKNDSREERNHTSHVISVSTKKIPEVVRRIQKFQHELANYIEDNHNEKDEVIAMQFSLFKLSNLGESK